MACFPITPEAGRIVADETVERSYDQAVEHVRKTHAIFIGKELAIHMTGAVGQYWLEQDREALRSNENGLGFAAPAPQRQAQRCLIFADGVMIHTDGAWHEARVGTVRSQMADGKQCKSSIARLCDLEDFKLDLWRKAHQMGYGQAELSAFIADGSHWLWNLAGDRFGRAVQILDFWHLCEHVGACAKVFFGEGADGKGTDIAKAWSVKVCGTLRAGLADDALREVETLPARSPTKRNAKHDLVTYIHNNRTRIDYPRYEAFGLPIGSGEVEAQGKTLVQARCKQSGMRWSRHGAEQLLRVRCAVRDGSFDTLFNRWPTDLAAWMTRQKRQKKKAA